MNKKYIAGRRLEYLAKKELEAAGFNVMRTAGSHGIADIIAVNSNVVRFIQVKKGGISRQEADYIRNFKFPSFCQMEIWLRIGRKWEIIQ